MGVFANGLEISGKAVDAKTIAAMPDTCFTPPEAPPTPTGVPIPYPSFGMASDTDKGTGTVKNGGNTDNIKNKSDLTKTSGTEAGCAAKKGVITSKNTGKKYFNSWSNDVKFDGEPVIRFTDLATHNHASPGGQTAPSPEICKANSASMASDEDCMVGSHDEIREKCNKRKDANGNAHESHHVVPDFVYRFGKRGSGDRMDEGKYPTEGTGFAICIPRDQHRGAKSRVKESVHGNLDKKLREMGRLVDTAASPSDTASIKKIRGQCFAALAKLVPKYISKDCYKRAVEGVMEQTKPFMNNSGKTKNRPLAEKSSARTFLGGQ